MFNWLFKNDNQTLLVDPYTEITGVYHRGMDKLEVVIKPDMLDTSNMDAGDGIKEYRPLFWNEYIGQESAKNKVRDLVIGSIANKEVFPHLFISGYSGMGKTLFSSILASQLNKKIVFTTGGELKTEQMFVDKVTECEGGVLFVDEANRINKRVGFFMLPMLEQFMIHGKSIKKFTIIFATTHIGDISKDLDALIQRCEKVDLEPYENEDLLNIVKQYKEHQYPSAKIKEEDFLNIVNNCRQVPRNAKNLVRSMVYTNDWEKVKQYNNIVFDGLTKQDIKVLNFLKESKGAGQNIIANYLRVKSQTYQYDIEPYLAYKELIMIKSKRVLTDKGFKLLEMIKG